MKDPLKIALNFIKFRPRSIFEVEEKLKRKKFSTQEINSVVEKLKKADLLDDVRFAKMWVEDRIRFRPSGKRVLYFELIKLGIAKEIAEETLASYGLENEFEAALEAAQSKKRFLQKSSDEDLRKKLGGFLSRRGFSWSIAKRVIEEIGSQRN